MNFEPSKKYGGDLLDLKHVDIKDVKPHKVYYIRMRNKDQSKNVWGSKQDFVGRVHMIDDVGISFDSIYTRNADSREGKPVWKKTDNRILILKEAFLKKDTEDNTMFFVDPSAKSKEGFKSKTRKFFKKILGVRNTRKA